VQKQQKNITDIIRRNREQILFFSKCCKDNTKKVVHKVYTYYTSSYLCSKQNTDYWNILCWHLQLNGHETECNICISQVNKLFLTFASGYNKAQGYFSDVNRLM